MILHKCPAIIGKQVVIILYNMITYFANETWQQYVHQWLVIFLYLDCNKRYRVIIMIHQNLRLGKCWKLFRAFFNKSIQFSFSVSDYMLKRPMHSS